MSLLIDGYNLIHSAGLVAQPPGPGGLERARRALCEFLAASLAEPERGRTTVVFDARQAPPDREHVYVYQGITVRFAVDYNEADELIEDLIKRDSAPRQLTVVSSDHRLHRAARRRRAKAVDSDVWYAELVRRRMARQARPEDQIKPVARPSLGKEEIEAWSRELVAEADDSIFPPDYLDDLADADESGE
jgi:predicted RNA-binding protein with PIN domain